MAIPRSHTERDRRAPSWAITQRRTRTVQVHPVQTPALDALSEDVYRHVRQSFIDNSINVVELNRRSTDFVTAKATSEGHRAVLNELLQGRQFLISDQELILTFRLVEARRTDRVEVGVAEYYPRSWPVTVEILTKIIAHWDLGGYHPEQAFHWLILMAPLLPTDVVYLRYIGTCTGPNTPSNRHDDDLKYRTDGLFGHFVRGLLQFAPELLAAGKAYVFVTARLDNFVDGETKGQRERILIAVFGQSTLINQQLGGFLPSFIPGEAYTTLFQRLKTTAFAQMSACQAAFPPHDDQLSQMHAELTFLWEDYDEFGDKNPAATGTASFPLSLATKQMQVRQASPQFLFCGSALALCTAEDTVFEEYLGASPFFAGQTRSANLTLQMFSQLEVAERNPMIPNALPLTSFRDIFPFVDLFPFMGTGMLEEHLELLRTACEITRPWLNITVGRLVTSCVRSNFLHPFGIPTAGYLSVVGVPHLHSFAPLDWIQDEARDEPPDDSFCINMPHLHPGYDKYGKQSELLRAVIYLSWAATFLLLDILLKTLPGLLASGLSRKAALLRVIAEFKIRAAVSSFFPFFKTCKDKLRRQWTSENSERQKKSKLFSDVTREILSATATERVMRNELAEGAPDSPEREVQIQFLWRRFLPDLHVAIPHTPENREAWLAWARGLDETTSYYMRMLYDLGIGKAGDCLRHVLISVAPEGATDDTWMDDPELREQALKRKGEQLRAGLPADHFSSEKQRLRRMAQLKAANGDIYDYLEVMQGRQINVQSTGTVQFYWLRDGEKVKLRRQVPRTVIPSRKSDKQYLSFVADGIDIVDDEDRAVEHPDRAGPVILRDEFVLHPQGDLFLEMWTAEMQRLLPAGSAAPVPSVPVEPESVYGPKGRIPCTSLPAGGLHNLQMGDAQWIVHQFLTFHFPTGRAVCTYKDHWPVAPAYLSIRRLWLEFLPDYAEHPHFDTWNVFNNRDMKTWVRQFLPNVQIFRAVASIDLSSRFDVDGVHKKVTCKKWTIGPPQ